MHLNKMFLEFLVLRIFEASEHFAFILKKIAASFLT